MRLFRIRRSKYALTAFSGDGSLLVPGRWHSGARMIYTATSIALAATEVFVNLNRFAEPQDLVLLWADLPAQLSPRRLEESQMTEGWRENLEESRQIGMEWFTSRRSVALLVPSVAVMGDWNVLLNPQHPEFARLTIAIAQPFGFDPRMFQHA